MRCQETQLLIAPHILGDTSLPVAEREGLEAHLGVCTDCAEEYRQTEQVIRAIRGLPRKVAEQALAGNVAYLENLNQDGPERQGEPVRAAPTSRPERKDKPERTSKPERTLAEGWAEIEAFIDTDLERRPRALQIRRVRTIRLFRRVGALAACITLVVAGGTIVRHLVSTNASNEPNVATQSASLDTPSTGDGQLAMGTVAELEIGGHTGDPRPVAAGELLTAATGQRLQVRLWDRHEITLEPNTRLMTNRSQDGGCVVALSVGQIIASVNRSEGEGVFRVVTPQAELTVTGTVFTVTAGVASTELSVREGTVELAANQGESESVSAGQTFITDGITLAKVEDRKDEPPLDLAALVDRMRDEVAALRTSPWYKKRFAPLLHLHDYLTAQGVEADELTLLAISADLWCIQYPKDHSANQPPYIHRKAGLERAARFYGYQVEWVTSGNRAEATALARQTLSAGDLVLAYGIESQEVEALDANRPADKSVSKLLPYRFLGEEKEVPYGLARISRLPEPRVTREQLAKEAVADMRRLLTATVDTDYLIGQSAVEAWAEIVAASQDGIALGDPVFQSLNAIAKLAVASSQGQLVVYGVPMDSEKLASVCRQLEEHGRTVFSGPIVTQAECEEDRENRQRQLAKDFVKVVNDMAKSVTLTRP